MSLTDFKAKMNKSKINKYKINENNKTNNTKHECNVKYERYKQDTSKDTLQMQKKVKKTHIFAKTCLPVMPSLLPQLLRQLKNNQNQTNTTGAQNLNEFNNTAGWLSVFFVVLFCNELILSRVALKPTLPLPSRLGNKKDKCSHLVIWTSTLSIIRIQKLFVIGN